MKYTKFLCFFVMLQLLNSCGLFHTKPDEPAVSDEIKLLRWQDRENQLRQLEQWQLKGKFALRNGQESVSAKLLWKQIADRYEIRLSGPLGQSILHINGDHNGISMKTSDGQEFSALTPEALISQQLGWNLPLSNMFTWIRGLPLLVNLSHQLDQIKLDNRGQITHLQEDGWWLKYSKYSNYNNYQLPGKLVMENGDLKVTIIIKNWVL